MVSMTFEEIKALKFGQPAPDGFFLAFQSCSLGYFFIRDLAGRRLNPAPITLYGSPDNGENKGIPIAFNILISEDEPGCRSELWSWMT